MGRKINRVLFRLCSFVLLHFGFLCFIYLHLNNHDTAEPVKRNHVTNGSLKDLPADYIKWNSTSRASNSLNDKPLALAILKDTFSSSNFSQHKKANSVVLKLTSYHSMNARQSDVSTCKKLVPRLSEKVLPHTGLVSFCGSGNTWTRHLLQQASGWSLL